MTDLIVSYSRVMRAEIDRLNGIAQNVANANSVGYMARTSAINGSGFLALMAGDSSNALSTGYSSEVAAVSETGIKTNVAVIDDAWFVVKRDSGGLFLTRSGAFHVNAEGQLRLGKEYSVMGEAAEIANVSAELNIMANGDVLSDKGYVDQLKLVKVGDISKLQSVGEGVYKAGEFDGLLSDVAPSEKKLMQGALNNSNVKVGDEMVKVTEITRHIESVQRAMSAYDDMLKSAINELGK